MYFYCNQQRRKSQFSLAWASWSTLPYFTLSNIYAYVGKSIAKMDGGGHGRILPGSAPACWNKLLGET